MTTTLRMPDSLAEQAKAQAICMGASLNDFILMAIAQTLEQRKEAEWRAGFEAMGRDPESTDVSYAFTAQAEVVLAD